MSNNRIEKLLSFLAQDPQDPFIIYALATEYNQLKDKAQAYTYYEILLKDHPKYVGTYYHLAKLLESDMQQERALEIYQQGIQVAREKRDMHALSELQAAYNTAAGLDYEDD